MNLESAMAEESRYVIQTEGILTFADRPRTEIGPQGDHVTAYDLFKEIIRQVSEKDPLEAFIRIANTLRLLQQSLNKYIELFSEEIDNSKQEGIKSKEKEINNAIDAIFSDIKKVSLNAITEEEIKKTIQRTPELELQSKLSNALPKYNQILFDTIATQADNIFLFIRNRLKYVSFPREGNVEPPPGEPARVKGAIKTLREYNDNPKLIQKTDDLNNIVEAIQRLFWYPKIPENMLIDVEKNKKVWNEIKRKKGYKSGTKPRNNDFDILCHVTAMHIDTIASCFPVLKEPQFFENIILAFIEQIAKNWSMKREDFNEFLQVVTKLIRTEKKAYLEEQKEVQAKMESVLPSENVPTSLEEVQKNLMLSKQGKVGSTAAQPHVSKEKEEGTSTELPKEERESRIPLTYRRKRQKKT